MKGEIVVMRYLAWEKLGSANGMGEKGSRWLMVWSYQMTVGNDLKAARPKVGLTIQQIPLNVLVSGCVTCTRKSGPL